ncbi:alpha-L-glutamate ligase [Sphingomonas sp. MAH-20]|uniref:Alpha-L-glutamate ligase n=1 Tax=Sphingomonas horti TaxID=2682842 RepID=A0A6I4IWW1_9SPHN|nr:MULTISPECIES: alpha-L-glutamate ligase [Sphingomonas]MBA2920406.1 alpha-L-glutamate ligase [Sphingomonas sp. CGMCC 1.13658]MVO76660.1 alpha-L-glutamate ligase [Sphingomonas horti]
MADLAIVYEHPLWFRPLFAALDARGIDYVAIQADDHSFVPGASPPPAPLILNRLAQSSFLRSAEHPLFYAAALFDEWERQGATVINGGRAFAIDSSKARQLSLIASLGLQIPATRIVHRAADVVAAAEGLRFPIVVKANIGGSGAGIVRYDNLSELKVVAAEGGFPASIDSVLLVQEYVPAHGGRITRLETLDRKFLYAIDVEGGGAFDLCPADACVAGSSIRLMPADPSPELIAAAERIADAMALDVGGIEVMIDDRDGVPRFYDINALSNFVADPLTVLGWDPHERLVDWLQQRIARA